MQPRNTCRNIAGRLIEVDVQAGYRTVADVDEMIAMLAATLAQVPDATRVVACSDWRACQLMKADVAAQVVKMLERSNPRIERSAILHRIGQATSVLQVARLTKEALLTSRRVFTDAIELKAWLAEVLTEPELARLDVLLWKGEPPPHL